jgi:uncharacterized protein (DUF58 family)
LTRSPLTRSRRYRRLRFTREGKYFIALTLGVGFAAVNTGNNLLFLILGMMLALIVGSGILSEISLRSLTVTRLVPARVFAEQPTLVGSSVHNAKSQVSSFSIEVEDLLADRLLEKKCYFLKVLPGRTQQASYRHTFPRRGRYRLTGFQVSTQFPFSLFRKSRYASVPQDLVVYPRLHPVAPPASTQPGGEEDRRARIARRGDFHALREFRAGDDLRDVCWRKSAHLRRLMIRQHEEPTGKRVTICFDNAIDAELLSPDDLDRRERAVSEAASLAAHYIQRDYSVALYTRSSLVKEGSGEAQLDRLLLALALLEFVPAEGPFAPPRLGGDVVFVRGGSSAAHYHQPPRAA